MEAIQHIDFMMLDAIQQSLRCAFLDGFTAFISYLTTSGIIWIVTGVILLFFRKTRAAGITLLAALALAFLTGDVLLKHIVSRPRPFTVSTDIVLAVKAPSTSSFPSTHSCLAAAATTVLLAKRKELGIIALVLTVCVAFSRLYLYVHYPSDVLCGLLLGILCASLALWIANKINLERRVCRKKS